MIWLLIFSAAAAYQLLAWLGALAFLGRRQKTPTSLPAVSVLKPVHGLDPHFCDALRSHALQDYPAFEVLFGLGHPADPARPDIERFISEFTRIPMRLIISPRRAPNGKVAVLAALAAEARHPVLVVNDSDIAVPPDYLRRIVGPLEDPAVGMVTCLYRGQGQGWAARFEALGIATDFACGVLVARLLGVSEFAMGSTMVFRAADLARIGGFESVAEYLADDYQLGSRIRRLGLKVVLAPVVVTTYLPEHRWRETWRHQVRWARTIRVCRPGGYLGMPLTMATLWALLLAGCGHFRAAAALLALRLLAGLTTAFCVLRARLKLADVLLVPLRDLWGVAVWAAGLWGHCVIWRDQRLRITGDGRIVADESAR